jgi:hypothetical protein
MATDRVKPLSASPLEAVLVERTRRVQAAGAGFGQAITRYGLARTAVAINTAR